MEFFLQGLYHRLFLLDVGRTDTGNGLPAYSVITQAFEYFFGGEIHFDTIMHALREIINLGILNGFRKIINGIGDGFQGFGDTLNNFANNIKGIGSEIKGIFSDLREVIGAYKKEKTAEILKTVAVSLLMVAGALFIVSKIDENKIKSSILMISVMLGELIGSLAIVAKIAKGDSIKNLGKFSITMVSMSVALLILASALKKIASIDAVDAWSSIMMITVLMFELVAAMKLLTGKEGTSVAKGATVLLSLSISVNILANAMKKLSSINDDNLLKGVISIFAMLMMLVASVNLLEKKMGIGTGAGIVLLATSLLIVGEAIKKIGSLDIDTLKFGLIGIALALAAIVTALNFMPDSVLLKGISITIIATGLVILGEAIKKIGSLDVDAIKFGLIGIALALAAIVTALNFMPNLVITKSIAIGIISASLIILGEAIKKIGSLDIDTLKFGLIGIGAGLLAMTLALIALSNPTALVGAASLLVASASLVVLAKALKTAGSLGWESMVQGLLALVGVLAIVAGASVLLAPLIPAILGVGAALIVFALGLTACTIPLAIFVDLMKSICEYGPERIRGFNHFLIKNYIYDT